MNKDDSEQSTSSDVRSKYFTPEAAMDESLSDFQEIRKRCAGPKNTAKSKSSKPKKAPKRIRGQKDIRTVLRTKNELESYSKDFDTVCKKAGIDVDSEQLQLAIALSKSLQETASTSNETSVNSQTVNTQERVNKIRTTLQEYGFKVPEVKIAASARKPRKHRKNYKLILTSDTQKKEIVADKYSQVLFQNITQYSLYTTDVDNSNIPLYRLASNVTYDVLKVTDTFYVNNLIEKSTNSGNLLRDWSEIPGRPVSPKLLEPSNMNFSEIECSQEELDIVLSGTLKSCKYIVRNKSKDLFSDSACKIIIEDNDSNLFIGNTDIEKNSTSDHEKILKSDNNVVVNLLESNSTTKYRSCSPDIFDDDAQSFLENSKNSAVQEEPNSSEVHNLEITECVPIKTSKPHSSVCDVTKRKSNDLMEITECIPIQLQDHLSVMHKTGSQLSQKSNVTKRRSNDFMEFTECVGALSQPIQDNIDLTECPYIIKGNRVIDEYVTEKEDENLDVYHKNNSKPETLIPAAYPKHNEIDLTESPEAGEIVGETSCKVSKTPKEINPVKSFDSMDLTQSSNTSDELPFVSLTAAKSNSSDDTIIVDINDYANINRKTTNLQDQDVHIDLTQYSERNENNNQSFFEEYILNHSGNSDEPKETNCVNTGYKQCVNNQVNLTQSQKKKSNFIQVSTSSNCNELNFLRLSQSKPVNVGPAQRIRKAASSEHDCSNIIVDPVPVELHHSNSDNKLCKPGNVDLTQSPIEQSEDNEVNNVDLTQHSDTSEELSQNHPKLDSSKLIVKDISYDKDTKVSKDCEPPTDTNSLRYSSLGKIDDVSIDYDDILNYKANSLPSSSKNTSSKSVNNEISDENIQRLSKDTSFVLNCSQTSEIFEISDKELDYSMHQSKLEMPLDNFAFGGISIMDELSSFGQTKKSIDFDNNSVSNNVIEVGNEILPIFNTNNNKKDNKCREISPIKHRRITEIATPLKARSSNMVTVVTPSNSELVIKTNNITPKKDYESMSTPEIHVELDKYGIKPFKRKRAIKLLTHIYNQTHPTIETYADVADEPASPPKRRKLNDGEPITSPGKRMSPRKLLTSPRVVEQCDKCKEKNVNKNFPETSKNTNIPDFYKGIESNGSEKKISKRKYKNSSEQQKTSVPERIENSIDNVNSRNKETVFGDTTEVPIIRDIECKPEDWVFQKREKAKVHSCRVPLHVAFHNYVLSRRDLREAILCYEPVEIDVIHKDLVGYGHRYDPKDLLKFLDKKCITVKTTDNDARNQKRS